MLALSAADWPSYTLADIGGGGQDDSITSAEDLRKLATWGNAPRRPRLEEPWW